MVRSAMMKCNYELEEHGRAINANHYYQKMYLENWVLRCMCRVSVDWKGVILQYDNAKVHPAEQTTQR